MDKLRIHMVTHSDFHEFMCEYCAAQFKRKDKLMEHIKRTHLGPPKMPVGRPKGSCAGAGGKIKKPRKPRQITAPNSASQPRKPRVGKKAGQATSNDAATTTGTLAYNGDGVGDAGVVIKQIVNADGTIVQVIVLYIYVFINNNYYILTIVEGNTSIL